MNSGKYLLAAAGGALIGAISVGVASRGCNVSVAAKPISAVAPSSEKGVLWSGQVGSVDCSDDAIKLEILINVKKALAGSRASAYPTYADDYISSIKVKCCPASDPAASYSTVIIEVDKSRFRTVLPDYVPVSRVSCSNVGDLSHYATVLIPPAPGTTPYIF